MAAPGKVLLSSYRSPAQKDFPDGMLEWERDGRDLWELIHLVLVAAPWCAREPSVVTSKPRMGNAKSASGTKGG